MQMHSLCSSAATAIQPVVWLAASNTWHQEERPSFNPFKICRLSFGAYLLMLVRNTKVQQTAFRINWRRRRIQSFDPENPA